MRKFKRVLAEVNRIIDQVTAFDIILTSVLIFLAFYLGLMLINVNPWFGLFPTLAYLVFLLYKDISTNKFNVVERKYTPLYEKLRTAADYVNVESEIVEELQNEVISDLKKVRVSSFVRIRRISAKVLGSISLCLLILFASVYNVEFLDIGLSLEKAKDLLYKDGGAGEGDGIGDEFTAGSGGGDGNIFGDPSSAKLGNKEIEISLKQSSLETGVLLEEIPEREFDEAFPDEIFTTAASGYEEKITVENQKLVKDYFKELSKT